jgi:hypothetical protein
MMDNLVCENFAGSNIVAITESAGDYYNLAIIENVWRFDYFIYMNSLGLRTGKLKRVLRFKVAIYSCRS